MIVKVLGRNIAISVLSRRLREMWKPKGAMVVMDLPRQFFMVRFENEEEYMEALTGGPWRVFGSYLMVQAWSPSFDPLSEEITTTPVWVRLANLPINFYHRSILMGIAKGLGNPIRVDLTTLQCERARFARVCVEVNFKKPLKGTILINEERYFVSYEGLSNICSKCGLYGHLVHACPQGVKERLPEVSGPVHESPRRTNENVESTPRVEEGFTRVGPANRRKSAANGTSLSVARSENVSGENTRVLTRKKDSTNIPVSNSFGRLGEDLGFPDSREGNVRLEENKKNEDIHDLNREKSMAQVTFGGVGNLNLPKGSKDKRIGRNRPVGPSGTKPKYNKGAGPTRGLIFGPPPGEEERSLSGKRLRVESTTLGRSGGSFQQASLASKDGKIASQSMMGIVEGNSQELAEPPDSHGSRNREELPGSELVIQKLGEGTQ